MTLKLASIATGVVILSGCIGVSQRLNQAGEPGVISGAKVKRCTPGRAVPAPDGLLDDFEDGNTQLADIDKRGGYWWKSQDAAGSEFSTEGFKPADGGADGSAKGGHAAGKTVSGSPTDAWGVNFGANFSAQGVYDASKYVGIVFKAKKTKDSTAPVRFKVGDINTHPDSGGQCKSCWNHWGMDLHLTTEWKEYKILFSDLRQAAGWGDPRPKSIVPDKVFSFDFSIGSSGTFDIWVDDFYFLTCQ